MIHDFIQIDKTIKQPVYTQIVNQLIKLIQNGVLQPSLKLPGSRKLALNLGIHRKTVIRAFEDLITQGWIETIPNKGTFISDKIGHKVVSFEGSKTADFRKKNKPKSLDYLLPPPPVSSCLFHLDDGLPDPRLVPVKEITRAYKSSLSAKNRYRNFTYSTTFGSEYLRTVLVDYLFKTRSMALEEDQILISRGVTQALFLSIQALVAPGEKVAVPEINWRTANMSFLYREAELLKIKVDEFGLDVDHLETVCKVHKLKMIYVTPHHHYPTTVIMPAHRRLKLLKLASKYNFYIFEDDYDFDFHFKGSPLMPLAGADPEGRVLYAGSFTKSIAPVFRVGYLVASAEVVNCFSKIRRIVDRQGDPLLENALAELLTLGIVPRQIRKARKIYLQRRDVFTDLLKTHLDSKVYFEIPEGGMSVWARFESSINLPELALKAERNNLYFSDGQQHAPLKNHTRLGFASSNESELEKAVLLLKKII